MNPHHPPVPDNLTPLADFPGYAIAPDGEVWRLNPLTRGRYAGRGPGPLRPTTQPRSFQWYVTMTNKEGKRVRLSIRSLAAATFGVDKIPESRFIGPQQ